MSYIENLGDALKQLADDLSSIKRPWLVGGSCGLLMQGVPLAEAPRDLDLYADADAVKEIHDVLKPYSTDEQVEDRSSIYYSILSHYKIGEVKVELVGDFQVTASDSVYQVNAALYYEQYAATHTLGSDTNKALVKLMPLEHELVFNVLRGRPDRYEAIAQVLVDRHGGATIALNELLSNNRFSEKVTMQLRQLLSGKKS